MSMITYGEWKAAQGNTGMVSEINDKKWIGIEDNLKGSKIIISGENDWVNILLSSNQCLKLAEILIRYNK